MEANSLEHQGSHLAVGGGGLTMAFVDAPTTDAVQNEHAWQLHC